MPFLGRRQFLLTSSVVLFVMDSPHCRKVERHVLRNVLQCCVFSAFVILMCLIAMPPVRPGSLFLLCNTFEVTCLRDRVLFNFGASLRTLSPFLPHVVFQYACGSCSTFNRMLRSKQWKFLAFICLERHRHCTSRQGSHV